MVEQTRGAVWAACRAELGDTIMTGHTGRDNTAKGHPRMPWIFPRKHSPVAPHQTPATTIFYLLQCVHTMLKGCGMTNSQDYELITLLCTLSGLF